MSGTRESDGGSMVSMVMGNEIFLQGGRRIKEYGKIREAAC